jgi:hypothetical protein
VIKDKVLQDKRTGKGLKVDGRVPGRVFSSHLHTGIHMFNVGERYNICALFFLWY